MSPSYHGVFDPHAKVKVKLWPHQARFAISHRILLFVLRPHQCEFASSAEVGKSWDIPCLTSLNRPAILLCLHGKKSCLSEKNLFFFAMASEDYSKQSMEEVSSQFTEDTRTEKEKTEEVIEAVQKNRVIWFKGHPQYKIKEARDAGWIEAARMVRLTGKLLCLQ